MKNSAVGWLRVSLVGVVAAVVGVGSLAPETAAQQRGSRGQRSVRVEPGEPCPPGMTMTRPGRCQAPELPPPSIVDYRPRSTLVTEEHPVPSARFPVVDIHSHTGPNAETIDRLIDEMDELNIGVLVNLSGGSDPAAVRDKIEFIRNSAHPDRFRVFANVSWEGAGGPGWSERAVADLEQAVAAGAIGLKVAKNLGLTASRFDGARLRVDDPILNPVWEACARLDIPVIIHTAEPAEFFEPLDMNNERWLELALFPSRRNYEPGKPTFDELMAERDGMFAAHPDTRFIAAHFGWYASDLARAGRLLDELPNVVLEMSAVLYDFGRQPRAARAFFIEYQDRVLFGKDSYQPVEFPYYWRVLETADEYFDYYRDYHAFWKLYGVDLPDDVLRKLYFANALRVAPGLPQDGWPAVEPQR